MLYHLKFVFVKLEAALHIMVALYELCRAKARRNTRGFCMVLYDVSRRVYAAVHGTFVAEVVNGGQAPCFCGLDYAVGKLRYALALGGAYRDDRHAEHGAYFGYIDRAAVCPHLVHHIEGDHGGYPQLKKLERQVKVAFYVRGVNYVYYPVGLAVDYEIARHYLFLRIGADRINAGQIDHGVSAMPAYLARFLIDRHAGKVADMLI